jgi:hypothetical protein
MKNILLRKAILTTMITALLLGTSFIRPFRLKITVGIGGMA